MENNLNNNGEEISVIIEAMSGVLIDEINEIGIKIKDTASEMKNAQNAHYFNYLQGLKDGLKEGVSSLSKISDQLTEVIYPILNNIGEEE